MSAIPYRQVAGLSVHPELHALMETEALRLTGIAPEAFWQGFATIVSDLTPRFHELLAIREEFAAHLDAYHREHGGAPADSAEYERFLRETGYLLQEPAADAYRVSTKNVDPEIALLCAPQIVAPLSKANHVSDALDARWGSLYDALHGIAVHDTYEGIDKTQMASVFAQVSDWLDRIAPLDSGSHAHAVGYFIDAGNLHARFADETSAALRDARLLAGFSGPGHNPHALLLLHNHLHIALIADRAHPVGSLHQAGISDVIVEAAVSAIMDLQNTTAAASPEDKVAAYRNWLGLMTGTVSAPRAQFGNRTFTTPAGAGLTLRDRPLLLMRHAGHDAFTGAVLDAQGQPIPEGILDAAVTMACAISDITGKAVLPNSRTGSVYIIKPGMQGPDEVGLSDALFKRIEELLGLPKYTMKIGIEDKEPRTWINLAASMSKVRDRLAHLGTGHSGRFASEVDAAHATRGDETQASLWYAAYTANSVDIGLARNLSGRAQISAGIEGRSVEGASATRVATLKDAVVQAFDNHRTDTRAVQKRLGQRKRVALHDLLALPLCR